MALTRLAAHAPSIFEVLRDDGSKALRHLQHPLSQARDGASKLFVVGALIVTTPVTLAIWPFTNATAETPKRRA